jgi:hypothetical protein
MEEGCVYVWFFLFCEREQTRARQCGCVREVEREHAREILTLGRERDSERERETLRQTEVGRGREGRREGERGGERQREVQRQKERWRERRCGAISTALHDHC